MVKALQVDPSSPFVFVEVIPVSTFVSSVAAHEVMG